ncbi:MAG TPA: hypothetical protein VK826_13660 [Bacteroidia bacterium]|nr:hypothetical protein [Bacteroidia bacterium]
MKSSHGNELFLSEFVPLIANAMSLPVTSWPKELLWRFLCVYFFLYITTLSFDYYLLPNITNWFGVPFHYAASFTGELFFGVNLTGAHEFYSDSLLVYVHVFNLVLIATVAAIVWTWKSKRPFSEAKLQPCFFVMLRYFVAFNLFVYGFSKLYKWQFMLPEPNILYTTVGNTPRDLLYWTSMGTSYSYSVFMGLIEIIPGILLLFRRTTVAGAIIAVMVMTNVLAVNLGFDITVKLHSFTLLFMALVILIPARKRLLSFFGGKETAAWKFPAIAWKPKWKWLLPGIKVLVVLVLFGEAHYPYVAVQNFNDDKAERPPMHGAYEILETDYNASGSDGPVYVEDDSPYAAPVLQRIFILRRGYIVFEYSNGNMFDYPLVIDTTNKKFVYTASRDRYITYAALNDSTYTFESDNFSSSVDDGYLAPKIIWTVKKLDWEKLPLLEGEFTWIDEQ